MILARCWNVEIVVLFANKIGVNRNNIIQMAHTDYKNGRVSIIGLTEDEYSILYDCLQRCKYVMVWDENRGVADDGDNFLWEIDDRKEFDTLQNLEI